MQPGHAGGAQRRPVGVGGARRRRTAALVLGAALLTALQAAADPRVLIITSHDAGPYTEAVSGFLAGIRQQQLKVTLERLALGGDVRRAGPRLQQARSERGGIIFALGSLATRSAVQAQQALPVVAGLILSAGELGGARHATGVTLEFGLEAQLRLLRRVLPDAGGVGLVHSAQNAWRAKQAQAAARALGIALEARAVAAAHQIPGTLEALGSKISVLWGIADSVVLTPETARSFLLFSLRNRIAFVGPSASWAKAGALYGLDWDYADLGQQCATMAGKLLKGIRPEGIPVEAPRKLLYVINARTAAHLKLSLPQEILRGARATY